MNILLTPFISTCIVICMLILSAAIPIEGIIEPEDVYISGIRCWKHCSSVHVHIKDIELFHLRIAWVYIFICIKIYWIYFILSYSDTYTYLIPMQLP